MFTAVRLHWYILLRLNIRGSFWMLLGCGGVLNKPLNIWNMIIWSRIDPLRVRRNAFLVPGEKTSLNTNLFPCQFQIHNYFFVINFAACFAALTGISPLKLMAQRATEVTGASLEQLQHPCFEMDLYFLIGKNQLITSYSLKSLSL